MKKKVFKVTLISLFFLFVLFSSLYTFSFRLNGSNKVEVLYKDNYKDLGYKLDIFSASLKKLIKSKNNVDTSKLGKYQVTYQLPFKTLVREVLVVDKEKPIIELIGDSNLEIPYGSTYQEMGFKAIDNVDLDITEKVKVLGIVNTKKIGEYKIKYSVEDSSKNINEVVRIVNVVDKVSPIISLKGLNKIIVKVNEFYNDEGFIASDNVDGDISNLVKIESNIDYSKVGTYFIKYIVSDSSLNTREVVRTIEVIENIDITYINGILLVNKKYHLPSYYNPGVNSEAYQALLNLQNDAGSLGCSLPLLSGFRSYETQKELFNSYAARSGYEKANTFSALPGQSEHQTGLAFDIGEINDNFGNTPSGIWLKENAHKYGFIIRYLKGKEDITGYKYEPWHIRYVGSIASDIYNKGITLEEYLGVA